MILIKYYSQTAKAIVLDESVHGPAGQPIDNLPNRDGLRDFNRTVPKLTFQGYWKPGQPMWLMYGSNPDPDAKRRSRTIANITLAKQPLQFAGAAY